jgi:MoxR-like ATPase
MTMLTLDDVATLAGTILAEVEKAIIGKRETLELILLAILADGHLLIEDYPGLAKTLSARSFAWVIQLDFKRVQFTPDLMPSDLTGSSIYNQRTGDFAFRPGPVFTNLLLADEINRAPAKTQAALLEAMQERQVTIEGITHPLPPPFIVMATQNPLEYEGTYPLPEAQLDRFLIRAGMGYPDREQEWEVLERRMARRSDEVQLAPVVDGAQLIAIQAATCSATSTYARGIAWGSSSGKPISTIGAPCGSIRGPRSSARCRAPPRRKSMPATSWRR